MFGSRRSCFLPVVFLSGERAVPGHGSSGRPHHGEIPVCNWGVNQSHGAGEIHVVVVLGESGKVPRTGHVEEAQVAISSQPQGCLRKAK
jgi:hypothetical protein